MQHPPLHPAEANIVAALGAALGKAVVFAADALGPVSVSKVTNLMKDSGWCVPAQYSEVPQHVQ